ncbi:hypothetical protein [Paenibacillus macerans]|uniref:hypothetical protein n=1 Tax=Paenibacillus macerans TaxID=44252 RepID=UPI00203E454E|nr:hypothetical protein [Paenibacillus macerans]MCM3702800.1 hypothetical protein [Paenibacillus macerans]
MARVCDGLTGSHAGEAFERFGWGCIRQREADEVEVFGMFGGGLPVLHRTVTVTAKGMGDRSHKPYGQMEITFIANHECT